MPTRYLNLLSVDGAPNDVHAFAARVEAARDQDFGLAFGNVAGLRFGAFMPLPDRAPANARRAGWGTPDDVHDSERYGAAADGWLSFEFSTEDAPPTPVVRAIQAQHPSLTIRLRAIDPSTGFQTTVDARGREAEGMCDVLDPGVDAELDAHSSPLAA